MLLMILLAVTTTGWVVTALNRDRPAATAAPEPPRAAEPVFVFVPLFGTPATESCDAVDLIAVPVAARDLPVGTMITKDELSKSVNWKRVRSDSLPPHYVADEADLVGQRLTRPVLKDETFAPGALTKRQTLLLPEDLDVFSLPISAAAGAGGFVGPGSRVDVLAGLRRGEKLEVFPLLENVLVVAVETRVVPENPRDEQPDCTVSFALDQEQALLLTLARQRECRLELLLRHPGKPAPTREDYKKRRQLLEEPADPKPEVAPAPRPKRAVVHLPDGMDMISLPFPAGSPPAAGFVAPGSRVNILAVRPENPSDAFQLLDGVLVISLSSHLLYPPDRTCTLHFAVDEQQALLLALARQAGCTMEVHYCSPDHPVTATGEHFKKRAEYLQKWLDAGKVPVAPAPRAKGG
jgi:Flp pilus assembly protein CpaB